MRRIWRILPVCFVAWWARRYLGRQPFQGETVVQPFDDVLVLVDKPKPKPPKLKTPEEIFGPNWVDVIWNLHRIGKHLPQIKVTDHAYQPRFERQPDGTVRRCAACGFVYDNDGVFTYCFYSESQHDG